MSYAIHNQNLAFNDSAIAQYMNTDFIVIDISLCVALAREQFFEKLKDDDIPSHIFIEDNGRLAGLIAVRKLLQATDTVQPVKGLMISDFIQLKPEDERADVAGLLAHAGADVVPVVTHGKLVGCLTEREIAHLLEDDVTEDAQLQGATLPLEKPYLETSAFSLWKKRSVWLLLLLFVAEAYTSSVIQHFEEALESAIALAFFIPLLIGTGGNSGTQITSTLVRAMALGEVHLRDVGRVLRKEISTSLMIAATLGLAGCVRAWMMGIGMEITLIVSLTLVCITLWSAIVSSVIPMVLKRCKIDPAVVSAPFIATLIDGTGLIIYFKIAQYTLGLE
ncbi:magnesium transporter [Enterobacter hormaechei]|nr:magnesium transporter [Enterobacter hormaechei]MED5640127.1 magnesium transporter [Enterobacter hormaechei]